MDIKVQNLLLTLDAPQRLKIADLGLCREMVETPDGRLILEINCAQDVAWVGTVINQPPEYIEGLLSKTPRLILDYSYDIWSAGLVAYYLLIEQVHPFTPQGITAAEVLRNPAVLARAVIDRINISDWSSRLVDTEGFNFVLFLLFGTNGRRPTAEECLDHPFLTDAI
eukprot:Blabericola_migrator_1__13135@NODE_899_length_6146_cov_140_321928_g629_i0_p6_GENE_NODE_899_length_6146_cov_140_321928_g629_i0NODE_899_length_6146_cov_140_321928_g629_i0_p6_ORF_typecomplete_len168_score29_00Pkinase/PF00069_25/3_1e13Pkinase_Tyr/PF07714_17/4_4e05Kinaselike/PF14531_6/0_2_NODE_899_length_6146_cov_140_321928_g629_i013671870